MIRSLFITFEGPDGSGKSTQSQMLASELRRRGVSVVLTREPGGTAVGEHIRPLLLDTGGPPMTPLVMALLLSAARAQHVTEVIEPALKTGSIVISDRFADSTLAYQGYGMGSNLDELATLTEIAVMGITPDITIYIDLSPEVGLARIAGRGNENRLDRESLEFHHRVRNGYLSLMEEQPGRWICVDGESPSAHVHAAVLEAIAPRICPKEGTQ